MPTYDYVCDACEHAFEEFQAMSAKPLKRCPKCGKQKLRRLIGTGAGFIFKGGGFYETDYRSDSYKKDAKADKEAGKSKSDGDKPEKKGESSEKKADTKPAKSESASTTKTEPKATSD
jgi:putative FmdB family regulatory protein